MMSNIKQDIENPFELIKQGNPFFVMASDGKGGYVSTITDKFNVAAIVEWMKAFSKENKKFKKMLPDILIDLSKEV